MTFSAAVEAYRPLFQAATCDLPIDFILDWAEKESGGDACNLTTSAGFDEIGLLQFGPADLPIAGYTENQIRENCNDPSFVVQSSIDYLHNLRDLAHQDLQSIGTDWDESTPDFWSLVRLKHAEGPHQAVRLAEAASNLGYPPTNWDEFVNNSTHNPHWVAVAAEDGSWAAGFQSACSMFAKPWVLPVVMLVGIAFGAFLYERRVRVGHGA